MVASRFLRSLVTTAKESSLLRRSPPANGRASFLRRLWPFNNNFLQSDTTVPVSRKKTIHVTPSIKPISMFTQDGPDLIQGLDFQHWVVVTDPSNKSYGPRDKLIDFYIETLAKVVGSEEEAKKKIYSVYTNQPCCAFGVHVSEEVATKINELDNVLHVVPDSYMDVANKRYAGEPFINGQAVPYDRKYYEEHWRSLRKQIIENTSKIQSPNCDKSRVETRKIVVPPCVPDLPENNRYSRLYNGDNSSGTPNTGNIPPESCMSRSANVLPNNFFRPNMDQPQSDCGAGVQPGYAAGEPGNAPAFQHGNVPRNNIVPNKPAPGLE